MVCRPRSHPAGGREANAQKTIMPFAPRRLAVELPLRLALGVALGCAGTLSAQALGAVQQGAGGYGPGMMGGQGMGMMGGRGAGVNGGDGQEAGQPGAGSPGWNKLTSYIHAHALTCMTCHAVTGRGVGPAFADIAHRFAGQANGQAEMAKAISGGASGLWPGYPPMPGGLASSEQARILAGLILQSGK